jgi:hypothetical protein
MKKNSLRAAALQIASKGAQSDQKRNRQLVKKLMLGIAGNRDRYDLSEYLVHFTKDPDAYFKMLNILGSQSLQAGQKPFGCSRYGDKTLDEKKNRAICFSEAPLGFMHKFASKRSVYGIGFPKKYIVAKGGLPIWYVPSGSTAHIAIRELRQLGKEQNPADRRRKMIKYDNPIWNLCPFIEETRDFGKLQHQYQWEREWRIVDSELKFAVNSVTFLIIPEFLHVNARQFFREAKRENTGPSYLNCPYIDGSWNLARYCDEE